MTADRDLEMRLEELKERAMADDVFLDELRRDPEGVLLRETGIRFDELRQHAEELTEGELAGVAGGSGGHKCGCGESFGDGVALFFHQLLCPGEKNKGRHVNMW